MSKGKVFIGVLAGIAAGTLLGIAIAPKKTKAQKILSHKGQEMGDALNAAIDRRFETLLQQMEDKFAKR